jgi:hypothetical protein
MFAHSIRLTLMFTTVLTLLLSVAPRVAHAQLALVGRVTTEAGTPISGAEVRVSGRRGRVTSDSRGFFSTPAQSSGLVYFGVRRSGYVPISELVRIRDGDTVDVVLERISPELDTVVVQAKLDDTWERALRRYGVMLEDARFGAVITSVDIAEREPQWLSDMLYGQVGFTVIGNGSAAEVIGRARCRPNVFVDGMFARGFHINNMQPQIIKMMILYRNFTALPSQLQVPTADRQCGGIVIYTN